MRSKTSATLLERLRDGSDDVAWQEFFRRYGMLIYASARRRGCSNHTAEEIVQDVMLKVFEHRDLFNYDPSRGRFRDWLGTVVRNTIVSHRRRPSQRIRALGGGSDVRRIEPEDGGDEPDALWENAFEQTLLLALLDVIRREMSPQAYLAFELSVFHGLPGAKVAAYTGLTRNSVYRARKRGLKRLSQLGTTYREDGQLQEQIKDVLRSRPEPALERSLSARIEKTKWSKWESPRRE